MEVVEEAPKYFLELQFMKNKWKTAECSDSVPNFLLLGLETTDFPLFTLPFPQMKLFWITGYLWHPNKTTGFCKAALQWGCASAAHWIGSLHLFHDLFIARELLSNLEALISGLSQQTEVQQIPPSVIPDVPYPEMHLSAVAGWAVCVSQSIENAHGKSSKLLMWMNWSSAWP